MYIWGRAKEFFLIEYSDLELHGIKWRFIMLKHIIPKECKIYLNGISEYAFDETMINSDSVL